MTAIKRKVINPENWVDDEVTYSIDKDNNLIFNEEIFPIKETKIEDGSTIYRLERVGIIAFKVDSVNFYAVDDCDICSREAKDPIDAIVKVLANIF